VLPIVGPLMLRRCASGIAHTVQRRRASFQYAASQHTQSVVRDKLPHNGQRLGNAKWASCAKRGASRIATRVCASRHARTAPATLMRFDSGVMTRDAWRDAREKRRSGIEGRPRQGRATERMGVSEYTSQTSPIRPTCPRLPQELAVRTTIPGTCGASSIAVRRLSTRLPSFRVKSRSACVSGSNTSR